MNRMRSRLNPADERGSVMGALLFAIVIAAVLATATLAAIQISRSHKASQDSGIALLQIGDRVQVALDEVNTTRTGTPVSRISTGEQCREGMCTTLTAAAVTSTGQIRLTVKATTPDGATATRQTLLQQLPSSGVVTGVDSQGRLQFVQDAGTGTDLWQVVANGSN